MKNKNKCHKIKFENKQGFALGFVMMIFSIIMILVMSILTVSNFSVKSSIIYQNQNKAYYLARAGAEAVKKAWQDTDTTKPEGDAETIFVNENHDFKLQEDLTSADKIIGTINTSINRIIDDVEGVGLGAWEIISVAEVNGIKAEAKLTSTGATSTKELNDEYTDNRRIVDNASGVILTGNEKEYVSGRNYEYDYITYHDEIRGTLLVNPDSNIIQFNKDSFDNPGRHIAIIGQSIYFEKPIDLILTGEVIRHWLWGVTGYKPRKGSLIVSGETIVFKKRIEVKFHERWWLLAGTYIDYGLLMLEIPDGLGFYGSEIRDKVEDGHKSKIKDDERYGRVYFMDTIQGYNDSNISDEEPNKLSGKAFYFSKGDSPVIIGDKSNPMDKLIPMKNHNPVQLNQLPTPETNPIFFWK